RAGGVRAAHRRRPAAADRAHRQGGKGLITTQPACQDAVGLVRAVAGAQFLSALGSARIDQVQVNGARATARVVDVSQFQPQQVGVEKVGTSWKIAGVLRVGG
ncbi:MAG: hypothetical protein ACXVVQ_22855, partial [Solirubrobacteraceae bacterium]